MAKTIDIQLLWRFPVDVVDAAGAPAKSKAPSVSRAICVDRDGTFHVVTLPTIGPFEPKGEVSFSVWEGVKLAEAVLSGNQQAMTRPGAMRIIAATAKILAGVLDEPDAAKAIGDFAGKASS